VFLERSRRVQSTLLDPFAALLTLPLQILSLPQSSSAALKKNRSRVRRREFENEKGEKKPSERSYLR